MTACMTKKPRSGKATGSKKRVASEKPETDNIVPAFENTKVVMAKQEISNTTEKVIAQDNSESSLLKLPAEIKQKIWTLAIMVDEDITPVQLRERSNKFLWSRAQIDDKQKKTINAVSPLMSVQLSRVCRTIYEEISLTHLFYKVNRFLFLSEPTYRVNRADLPLNYLVALTSPRMKAIRTITCDWSGTPREAPKLFAMLATCDGLQELQLTFHYDFHSTYYQFANGTSKGDVAKTVPGYKEALTAVEGLQTLKLKFCGKCNAGYETGHQQLVTKLEPVLKERMKNPRGTTKCNLDALNMALREAKLDIHGDGRLGDDKKPGIVASRTRHQLRKLETLTEDGTIPKTIIPKYNTDGDIAWHVEEVVASRISQPEGFPASVEFQVKLRSLTGASRYDRSDLPSEVSWEDVASMSTPDCRVAIYNFYNNNPHAYGKEEVVESWNLRDHDSDLPPKELRYHQFWTHHLIALANRQSKIEERQAENDAKAAAKEAEKKKKKAKKGTKK